MTNETKSERWECCGERWDELFDAGELGGEDGPVRAKFCPMCGKPRPAHVPELTEDERLALELRNAGRRALGIGPDTKLEDPWDMAVLARARELLCPAAEAKGEATAEPPKPQTGCEVERYEHRPATMVAADDGEWVMWADYVTATAPIVPLSAEVALLKADCIRQMDIAREQGEHAIERAYWEQEAKKWQGEADRLYRENDNLRVKFEQSEKDREYWYNAGVSRQEEVSDLRVKLAEAERLRDEDARRWTAADEQRAEECREKNAEIARLTRELEGARKVQAQAPAPQLAPGTVTTELEKVVRWFCLIEPCPRELRRAFAVDQAAAVKAATEKLAEDYDAAQETIKGLREVRDAKDKRIAELEARLAESNRTLTSASAEVACALDLDDEEGISVADLPGQISDLRLQRDDAEKERDAQTARELAELKMAIADVLPVPDAQGVLFPPSPWYSFDKLTGFQGDDEKQRDAHYRNLMPQQMLAWAERLRKVRALLHLDRPAAKAETVAATEPDKHRGLYRKYRVERADGSSGPGGKHEHCEYYVLDWEHDRYAVPAMRAYADACSREFPELARDLRVMVNEYAQPTADADGDVTAYVTDRKGVE